MNNIIRNSNWNQIGSNGAPLCFSRTEQIILENCRFNGNRISSLTMTSGTASDNYDIPINVCGRGAIEFGYIIRAAEAESIILSAYFLNAAGIAVQFYRTPIEACVSCGFSLHTAVFNVPDDAQTVKLSIVFSGTITDCAFCAPCAAFI